MTCVLHSLDRATDCPTVPGHTLILYDTIGVEKIDTKRPLNLLKHTVSMRRLSPNLSPDGSSPSPSPLHPNPSPSP